MVRHIKLLKYIIILTLWCCGSHKLLRLNKLHAMTATNYLKKIVLLLLSLRKNTNWKQWIRILTLGYILLTTFVKLLALKTVDTIGNCQDQSPHLVYLNNIHEITNLWKFELTLSSKLRDNNERKNTLVTRSYLHLDAWFRDLKF